MVITETQCRWRLSSLLVYKEGGTDLFTPYAWSFDNLSRITQQVSEDGTSDYAYDSTSQLTTADHDYQADEAYSYDANGNRTMTGYSTGTNNRLLNDGTHTYTYDFEGNRTKKTVIATGEATEYEWDHRNRLVQVKHLDSVGAPVQTLDYIYDVLDRRIGKTDTPAVGPAYTERYVYDGEHLALKFGASALANRYLHGPVIDQILADEQVSSLSSPGDVLWPLADNLGTVRDLAEYDSGTGDTVIVNHISYDAYGGSRTETNAAVDHLFGYTGREWDAEADLQYNRARWYDPAVGRWLSEDPIGFEAGDANLSRYVKNSPTILVDPSGLQPPEIGQLSPNVPPFTLQPWFYQDYSRLRQQQLYYQDQGGDLPFSEGSRLLALERRVQWELAVWRAYRRGYAWYDISSTMALMPGGGADQAMEVIPGAIPSVNQLPSMLPPSSPSGIRTPRLNEWK